MKYMTFNSSCAFAGVANMLEQYGIDVEDRDIALGMDLPYLFDKDGDTYLTGPMLQSASWFNRYLHTIGFHMQEKMVMKEEVPDYLRAKSCAMLGLRVSPENKHAVVYIGYEKAKGQYLFGNNKWKHSTEPERFVFTRQELMERLDPSVMIAVVVPLHETVLTQEPKEETTIEGDSRESMDKSPLYDHSCAILHTLKQDLRSFCESKQSPIAIRQAMNTMFRAILLDAVTMLELAENTSLADMLRIIQRQFLTAVCTGNEVILEEEMSVPVLLEAIDRYIDWIREAGTEEI